MVTVTPPNLLQSADVVLCALTTAHLVSLRMSLLCAVDVWVWEEVLPGHRTVLDNTWSELVPLT